MHRGHKPRKHARYVTGITRSKPCFCATDHQSDSNRASIDVDTPYLFRRDWLLLLPFYDERFTFEPELDSCLTAYDIIG